MNHWKIAFFVCLSLLVVTVISAFLNDLDKGISLEHMQIGYKDTETDLEALIKIVNETDFTKDEVISQLTKQDFPYWIDVEQDTIELYRVKLIFEADTLKNIARKW